MKTKIIIVQIESVAGDIDSNINKINTLLKEYGNVDLIVLPELWTTGWDCPNFEKYAEELYSSKTLKFLKEIAVKHNSNVIGGSAILKKADEKIRNTCIILDRNGNILDTYDKFHLFSLRNQSEGLYLEEGKTPVTVKTDIGKIGISTCYDIRFPEMFRLYAFNDTDLMVNMAAWPKNFVDEYITLAKARAIENQTYFITASLTGKINENFNFAGNSAIYDYQGRTVAKLDTEEKILYTEINLNDMKEYRKQMPILKDTKKKYQILEK